MATKSDSDKASAASSTGVNPASASGAASGAGINPASAASSPGVNPGSSVNPASRGITQRKGQFLIAPRRNLGMQMMGIAPLSFSMVEQALKESPDIEIIDRVGPKQVVGALGTGMQEGGVLVALMHEDKAQALAQQAQGQLIVERDQPLQLHEVSYLQQPPLANCNLPAAGAAFTAEFVVMGKGQPVAGAEVYLYGSMLPAQGVTDAQGRVRLALYGETAASLRKLYVKPRADFWSFYQMQPDISDTELNMVGLRALSDWPSLKNFPQQQQLTWGQRAMRLDQLPNTFRGQGVKVAVIDSGCANSHSDLTQVARGYDIVNKSVSTATWNVDTLAHGSHCTGLIAGLDSAGGIRGFVPDAEIHVCKLFPGGQVSQLIDALEYCIEQQIDVVNMSLGGAEPSEALEQLIVRARQAGIACIVAAGNSGGVVQYPGSSPNVLTVAAIGRVNEFPADSYHAQTVTPVVDANGFFSASFTCYGPEVSVCAPGVAITSSVPENSYAAWDGTSMAAPHVTGLAALALAHHPDFRGSGQMRSAARVERLFQIIKQSCQPLMLGDQRRTGFGLPDTLRAVGLAAPQGLPTSASTNAGLSALMGIPAMQAIRMGYRDLPALQAQSAALGMPLGLMSFPFSGGYPPSLNTGMMTSLW